MRLIDKKPLIRQLVNWQMEQFSEVGHEREFNLLDMIIRGIENEPTIEAVPVVHAEWKMRGGKLYCTNCGKKALEEKDRDDWYGCERSNFCPHCGADMRKKV